MIAMARLWLVVREVGFCPESKVYIQCLPKDKLDTFVGSFD